MIAEKFAFIFEVLGSKKVTEETKRLDNAQKDLLETGEKLSKNQEKLIQKNLELGKSVTHLIGTYLGFKKIFSEVLNFSSEGEELSLIAQRAGVGAEMLERYGIALKNYGGGLSSAASALSYLGQQLQDLKFGKGGALQDAALRYGINIYGKNGIASPEEMLFNIAKRMESLNSIQQTDLGKKLGLEPAIISLLREGVANLNKELEKAQEFTIYSKEDIEISRKFQLSLREFQQSLNKVWAVVARAILPVFTKVTDVLRIFFQTISKHKGFVLGFLGAVSAALGIIAIKSVIATAPFWLMVLAILAVSAAIGLIIDDIYTFSQGGESAFGHIVEWVAKCIESLILFGKKIFDFFYAVGEEIGTFIAEKQTQFTKNIKMLYEKLVDFFKSIGSFFENLWTGIMSKILGFFDIIIEKWHKLKSYIPFWSDNDEVINVRKTVEIGSSALMATNNPLSSVAIGSASNTNSKNSSFSFKIDEINVNTQATDAEGIARDLGDSFESQLINVQYQYTGGIT